MHCIYNIHIYSRVFSRYIMYTVCISCLIHICIFLEIGYKITTISYKYLSPSFTERCERYPNKDFAVLCSTEREFVNRFQSTMPRSILSIFTRISETTLVSCLIVCTSSTCVCTFQILLIIVNKCQRYCRTEYLFID